MNLLDILIKKGIINKYQIDSILEQSLKEEKSVEKILSEMEVGNEMILQSKSILYNIPKKNINENAISFQLIRKIPEDTAINYKMIPIGMTDGILEIGMIDPTDIDAQNALRFITSQTNTPFKIFVVTEYDFDRVIARFRGLSGEVSEVLGELDIIDINKLEKGDESDLRRVAGEEKKIVEDAPVTKMVAVILRHAVEGGASDVHIEHVGENIRVRFRIDGILHTSLTLPKEIHSAIVARVKILTNLKLDEKRRPQDGRFPAKIDGKKIDFRVSIIPTFYGEKVVIRILDPERAVNVLEKTGMSPKHVKIVRESLKRPYGLILITGPTGSGKTTTLYSMLREVDRDSKNVVSLEEPIEYQIPGISQSQVRPEIGYTFSVGLRSIVRQDPDIIMVGEIRDKETAQLAIQAALTGHLVLATLHTNNSIGIIPRLVDMGIDPYLIAPTLELAIAQRLVKRTCPGAASLVEDKESLKVIVEKQFADLPDEYRKDLEINKPMNDAIPIKNCPSGTKGRMAVFEMFKVSTEIERVILKSPTEEAIYKEVRSKGMITMKEDAIIKSIRGEVPFDEVNTL